MSNVGENSADGYTLDELFADVSNSSEPLMSELEDFSSLQCCENAEEWINSDELDKNWPKTPEKPQSTSSTSQELSVNYDLLADNFWGQDVGISDLFQKESPIEWLYPMDPASPEGATQHSTGIIAEVKGTPLPVVSEEKPEKKKRKTQDQISKGATRRFYYHSSPRGCGDWRKARNVLQEINLINNTLKRKTNKVVPSISQSDEPYLLSVATSPVVEITRLQTTGNGRIIIMKTK